MSRLTPIGRALGSLEDVKLVAGQLRNALEEIGLSLPRPKLLEVVARMCGAHHYDDLQLRLSGRVHAAGGAGIDTSAQERLLSLPEVLLLKKPVDEGALAEHLEFYYKTSATRWCYPMRSAAINPVALEAARRMALGEPLRPTDTKWLTGGFSDVSIIDDDTADGAPNVTALALSGAAYLGAGKWSVGLHYYCRVLIGEPLLIERFGVPMGAKAIADGRLSAQLFLPPPDFGASGFECFGFNIESQLTRRCLALPNPVSALESLQFIAGWAGSCRLRLGMMRLERDCVLRVITLAGDSQDPLAGLKWAGIQGRGGAGRGASRTDVEYAGASGLLRIWQEIRDWVATDISVAGEGDADTASISAIRRVELAKWIRSS